MFLRTQSCHDFGGCCFKAGNADKGDSVLNIQRATKNRKKYRLITQNKYFMGNKH